MIGRDTTAQALSWTIYLLLLHPEIKTTVIEELVASEEPSIVAESSSLSDLTSSTSETAYCPYTNAVISEALRLHPPVPLEIHENVSSEPIRLPDGTIVSPGEKVVWSPWAMSRSTRIWGENALEFKPQRWLVPATSSAPEHANGQGGERIPKDHASRKTAFEFPVFHAGPRSCLGKQLARIELIYAMRQLFRRYDFFPAWGPAGSNQRSRPGRRSSRGNSIPADDRDIKLGMEREVGDGLTGPIRGGLPVTVRRRNRDTTVSIK
jgi:cytochrome P450